MKTSGCGRRRRTSGEFMRQAYLTGVWKRIFGFMQEWEYLPEAPILLPILQDKKAETNHFYTEYFLQERLHEFSQFSGKEKLYRYGLFIWKTQQQPGGKPLGLCVLQGQSGEVYSRSHQCLDRRGQIF